MPDQLSLFPSDDVPGVETTPRPVDSNALDEMLAAARNYRNSRRYVEMLRFISRFQQYSTFNGCLLHIQNAGATYVATAGAWARRFNRKPRPDARPLMILAPMAPVLFLFDLAETEGGLFDRGLLKLPRFHGRLLQEVYDKTVENGALHGVAVQEVPVSDSRIGQVVTLTYNTRKHYGDLVGNRQSNYLIVLDATQSLADRYAALAHGLSHVLCGHLGIDDTAWWQDRRGAAQMLADIEADSVAFLVLQRKALTGQSQNYLTRYTKSEREEELPAFSLNAVFHAAQYIEDMGKAVWQYPRKKSRYLI